MGFKSELWLGHSRAVKDCPEATSALSYQTHVWSSYSSNTSLYCIHPSFSYFQFPASAAEMHTHSMGCCDSLVLVRWALLVFFRYNAWSSAQRVTFLSYWTKLFFFMLSDPLNVFWKTQGCHVIYWLYGYSSIMAWLMKFCWDACLSSSFSHPSSGPLKFY